MKKSGTTRSTKINWAKVDATSDAKIARQAQQDQMATPSDHTWQEMVSDRRITFVLPAKMDT
jgi:hypothetical protein